MELPSKELLSVIFSSKVIDTYLNDNEINYLTEFNEWSFVNIYELMHLMKEWAFQEYDITIWTSRRQAKLNTTGIWKDMPRFVSDDDDSTDISCVTKACEWILKESK